MPYLVNKFANSSTLTPNSSVGNESAKPSSEPNWTLQFGFWFGISQNQTAQFGLRFSDFEISGTASNPV